MEESLTVDAPQRISGWRYFWSFLLPVLFGWLTQALFLGSVLLAFFRGPRDNTVFLIGVAVLYPICSYAGISYAVGLIYAACWSGTSRPREIVFREMYTLWILVLLPTVFTTFFFAFIIYGITIIICRAGLNWGLNNWPKKPWEVWLGQRPAEVPAPRRLD